MTLPSDDWKTNAGIVLGIVGAIGAVARWMFSLLRLEFNRELDVLRRDVSAATKTSEVDRAHLWAENKRNSEEFQRFRGEILSNMFSKSDAAQMETRILAALSRCFNKE